MLCTKLPEQSAEDNSFDHHFVTKFVVNATFEARLLLSPALLSGAWPDVRTVHVA